MQFRLILHFTGTADAVNFSQYKIIRAKITFLRASRGHLIKFLKSLIHLNYARTLTIAFIHIILGKALQERSI